MRKWTTTLAAFGLIGALTFGAFAQDDAKKIRVAFVTNNASDFWKIAEAGTKKAAMEFGVDVAFRIPSKGTAEEQQQILQDLVTSGVSGIAISPKDPSNQTEMLNEAAAKANLVTQDSDAPDSNRLCYIGTNNYSAGVEAGKLVKTALPGGGKIMVCVGTMDAQNAADRYKGLEEELKGSKCQIIETCAPTRPTARRPSPMWKMPSPPTPTSPPLSASGATTALLSSMP
jgi:ribose transport system substrate-binding protein